MLLAVPMPLSSHSASAAGAVVGAGARVGGRRALSWAHRDGASARDGAVWIGASAGVRKRAAPARVRLAFGGGALPGVPLRRAPGGGELCCGFGELCGWGGGGGVWSDGGCKAPPERPWRVAEATRGGGWRGWGHGRYARQGRRGGVAAAAACDAPYWVVGDAPYWAVGDAAAATAAAVAARVRARPLRTEAEAEAEAEAGGHPHASDGIDEARGPRSRTRVSEHHTRPLAGGAAEGGEGRAFTCCTCANVGR